MPKLSQGCCFPSVPVFVTNPGMMGNNTPVQGYVDRLAAGEGVWKGEQVILTGEGLAFEFWIWGDGDGNCCPSRGRVSGSFAIENWESPDAEGFVGRLVPATYVRHLQ